MEAVQKGGVTISGLQGAGGIGKTALALKLAEQLRDSYPDAQFFLDLKGTTEPLTPAQAMAHIIRGFLHRDTKLPDDEAQLSALYCSVLDGKRALLLMDNAASREQVEPLIPPEGSVLLVTSRQHFTLPGLFPKNLDILPPEDARALLLRIAPRIGDSADKIAKVCGYLPLALRLAGYALAEKRTMSPADYVKRLEKAGGAVELIEPFLNPSYRLLNRKMQNLWRMLAVFPGTFNSLAAAAVWKIPPEKAEDALNTLISYSLVECDETTGRCHLHDLVRDFAETKLSESEREEAGRRHAEHYKDVLAVAGDLYLKGGKEMMAGLALFDVERRNIVAGQAWAAAHWKEDDAAARLCSYYPGAADLLELRRHPSARVAWLETALEAARRLRDRAAESRHLGNLGIAYRQLGKPDRAIECFAQTLTIHREVGDRLGEGLDLGNLGNAYLDLKELGRATECLEQQLAIMREVGYRRGEGNALGNLGNAYRRLGESRRAIEHYKQQLPITREIGDRRGEAAALWNMSVVLDDLGERDEAIAKAEAALEIFEQIEDPNAAEVRGKLEEWRKGV
ncbi:MAG: tetratricopeptide repeat protein [Armatimonadetes bacterium]|nr:tetratricopeptide repeat protein [Armatimonadota bacterium]NIO76625.1 tetratricopeptide repeat protein [Armatimonadota bacterium]NIO96434.1 tetratricopeptide repeat protein [Armatimonadota bacterium]